MPSPENRSFYQDIKDGAGEAAIKAPVFMAIMGVYTVIRNKIFPPKTKEEVEISGNNFVLGSLVSTLVADLPAIEKKQGFCNKATTFGATAVGVIIGLELFDAARKAFFPRKSEDHLAAPARTPEQLNGSSQTFNNTVTKDWAESLNQQKPVGIDISR